MSGTYPGKPTSTTDTQVKIGLLKKEKEGPSPKFKGKHMNTGYSGSYITLENESFNIEISHGGKKPYTREKKTGMVRKLQIVAAAEETTDEGDGTAFYGLTWDNQKVRLFVVDKTLAIPDPKTNKPLLDENGNRKSVTKSTISAVVLDEWPKGLKQ